MSIVATRSEGGFAERVVNLLERVDYRLAATDEDKEAIYRLRYNAYLREQAIVPAFSRRLSDKFDDLDNSWIFGLFVDGNLVSSIRITVAYWAHRLSPAVDAFPDVLNQELDRGRVIVDPTRFVIDASSSRIFPDLRYATTRIAWMAMGYFGADLLLASVRSEHQAFYRRVFGHEVVAAPRQYPSLIKPLSLMVCDYAKSRDSVNDRYRFLRSSLFERRMLFEHADASAVEQSPRRFVRQAQVPALAS